MRTKELGQLSKLSFTEPWEFQDTSKIKLEKIQDTLKSQIDFKLVPDSLKPFNYTLSVLDSIFNNNERRPDSIGMSFGQMTNDERRLTNFHLTNAFIPDSTYSLTLYPGAFTTYAGLTNDTTIIAFKVNTEDKYGSIQMNMEGLNAPAILQLLKGKDVVVQERSIEQDGIILFALLKPGKYKLKLIFDENKNGHWDPGHYLKGIQPERVLYYGKELDLKANFGLEETWSLEDE